MNRKLHRVPPLLVVGHSHSRDDHTAGEAQFRPRANTAMVPLTVAGAEQFFGISESLEGIGRIDFGERVLDVTRIPDQDFLSLVYYDRQTGVMLTGDSIYQGRPYVRDFPAFVNNTERVVRVTWEKIVTHLSGNQ